MDDAQRRDGGGRVSHLTQKPEVLSAIEDEAKDTHFRADLAPRRRG
jgi:hypothetical protein